MNTEALSSERITPEVLITRWQEVIDNPLLHDLPYKLEINGNGKVEFTMSPAKNQHAIWQFEVATYLQQTLGGKAFTECSVLTTEGVKVADAVWCSPVMFAANRYDTPYRCAPEICVEVVSASNTRKEMAEKTVLYLAAGAQEVWIVWQNGTITVHGAEGERAQSIFGITPPELLL